MVSVSDYYLKEQELPEEHRQQITNHIVYVHMSIQKYSKEYEEKLKRVNFATPKNYLDFLRTYKTSLDKNNKEFINLSTRYNSGLQKLKEAKESVSILRQDLEVKQK